MQTLDLFGGGNIDVVGDGFGILDAVVEDSGDFDAPALGLGLDFVFVADADMPGGFGAETVVLDLAFIAGFGGFGPGLEETDGPEIFVEADLFFFGHKITGTRQTLRPRAG